MENCNCQDTWGRICLECAYEIQPVKFTFTALEMGTEVYEKLTLTIHENTHQITVESETLGWIEIFDSSDNEQVLDYIRDHWLPSDEDKLNILDFLHLQIEDLVEIEEIPEKPHPEALYDVENLDWV